MTRPSDARRADPDDQRPQAGSTASPVDSPIGAYSLVEQAEAEDDAAEHADDDPDDERADDAPGIDPEAEQDEGDGRA